MLWGITKQRDWSHRSLLEIASPQFWKYCHWLHLGQYFPASEKQFPIMISTPVTICRLLLALRSCAVGPVVVSKMPALHPGDVRKLQAVDVPNLKHLYDVIVFPRKVQYCYNCFHLVLRVSSTASLFHLSTRQRNVITLTLVLVALGCYVA